MAFSDTPYSGMTPDEVNQARGRGQMMTRAGMDTNNITHWTQALGKVLQSGAGAAWGDAANQGEREGRQSANMLLAQALQGKNIKDNIGGMLANPWAADQGGALAGRYLQHQLDQMSPDAALRRQQLELNNRQLQEQIEARKQMFPLEQERLRLQVEEQRQRADDPMRQFMRGVLQPQPGAPPQAVPMPQAPQAPPMPQGPTPMPGVQLQSGPMEPPQDPALVQTQVQTQAQPQSPAPPAMPQPDMVTIPGYPQPVTRQQAEAMKLWAIQQKNDGLARHIESAIGPGLEASARTELDKGLINLVNQAGRLDDIGKKFDESFLKVGTQINNWLNAGAERLGVGRMTPDQQQKLMQFHEFRAAGLGHFNRMLKEMSGTAVTQQEFERIQSELPNPGTGFMNGALNGDSPTVFAAKWKQATKLVKASIARAHYLRNNRFSGDVNAMAMALPLDNMGAVITQRGRLLEQQFRGAKPQASTQEIQGAVKDQLRKEFGI